ncbi:ras-related protein Rab-5C-like [Oppia nitens]|uniref:ras-related protein Rab-5C-like n=1 Tax=Oppia nitens TaxID=1686743 RepID=UPI0023DBFD47|nr:ras-related protein Rab-5C-like [Oppia nitens]
MTDCQTFKLVFIGDSGVGKTSLVERTVRNCFNENTDYTIGAAFHKYILKTDDNISVTFNIWDTAGQERYRSLGPIYYRGANAAILVYDITSNDSFDNIAFWFRNLKSVLPSDIVTALVGNKSDLEHRRDVDYKEAKRFANKYGLIFMETSAKTALNIDILLKTLAKELIKRKNNNVCVNDKDIQLLTSKQNKLNIRKKCC